MVSVSAHKLKLKCLDDEGIIKADYGTLASDDIKYLFKNDMPKFTRKFGQDLFSKSEFFYFKLFVMNE